MLSLLPYFPLISCPFTVWLLLLSVLLKLLCRDHQMLFWFLVWHHRPLPSPGNTTFHGLLWQSILPDTLLSPWPYLPSILFSNSNYGSEAGICQGSVLGCLLFSFSRALLLGLILCSRRPTLCPFASFGTKTFLTSLVIALLWYPTGTSTVF